MNTYTKSEIANIKTQNGLKCILSTFGMGGRGIEIYTDGKGNFWEQDSYVGSFDQISIERATSIKWDDLNREGRYKHCGKPLEWQMANARLCLMS